MNIEQAKAISIAEILDKLNLKPIRKVNNDYWYLSPLRSEATASFHVHNKLNVWYDFGLGIGGDVIALATSYLESQKQSHTVSDGLRWLNSLGNLCPVIHHVETKDKAADGPKLVVKSVKPVKNRALIQYLEKRGIPVSVANTILKEVRVYNISTEKNIFALGLQNEEESYEIRNPFFKGCVGTKSITFIRGKQPKPEGINIFEGFMDYLSMITQQEGKLFQDDSIILNSLTCIRHAIPYVKNYGYKVAYTWMDNDLAGKKATKALADFFKSEDGLGHKPMNHIYAPYKDVNAWHMQKLGL